MKSIFTDDKKKIRWDVVLSIAIVIVITLLTIFDVFDKFEYRYFDLLMQIKPGIEERDDVVMVCIDDQSIANYGTFPWPRNILADVIIRMRELGARSVVFDIEYVSKSEMGVDTSVIEQMPDKFSTAAENISTAVMDLADAVSYGYISFEDFIDYAYSLNEDCVIPELQELYDGLNSNLARDNDKYFAQALHYFGNSWLTFNVADMQIEVDPEYIEYIKENLLLNNVTDPEKFIDFDCNNYYKTFNLTPALTPALQVLIEGCRGAGFTNVLLDSDGTRRRVKLLFNSNDKHVGQLVFAPMLKELNPTNIIRKKNALILENATFPGDTKPSTISIPLDSDGNMIVHWIKDMFNDSFKIEPAMFVMQLDDIEKNIVTLLKDISGTVIRGENGYVLPYLDVVAYLLDEYEQCASLKSEVLTDFSSYSREDPRYDNLFAMRKQFFADCAELTDPYYLDQICARLADIVSEEDFASYTEYFSTLFTAFKDNLTLYTEEFDTMAKTFDNAFCIMGHTATASTDLGTTPLESNYPNVGTHANVYNTIMSKSFITPVPRFVGLVFAAIVLLLSTILTAVKELKHKGTIFNIASLSGIVLLIMFSVVAMILFNYYVQLVAPLVMLILGFISTVAVRFFLSEKDKSFLKRAFSTFLSKEVVDILVKSPDLLKLGGEEKNATAIFTDIRGFSTFSEKVTPTQLVSFLNKYLTLLSDIIMDNRGTIDKYEGDAIIGFFGAPITTDEHAWQACISAVRMKQAEAEFNKVMLASGEIPSEIRTRIGLNSGDMVIGNMGTDQKMNYTMMGNNVNLAARLEGVNKVYKTWILASQATWENANRGAHEGVLLSRRLDKVRVVGISTPVQLYNIVGVKAELSDEVRESVKLFNAGIDHYQAKDFSNAAKLFAAADKLNPTEEVASVFLERCNEYIKNGVSDDWDGVVNMMTK